MRPTTLVPLILANLKHFEPGEAARKFAQGLAAAAQKEQDLLARLRALPDGEQKASETALMIRKLTPPRVITSDGEIVAASYKRGAFPAGAIVGLPAVVGVERATQLIRDGQRIRVHGTDGYVELLEPCWPSRSTRPDSAAAAGPEAAAILAEAMHGHAGRAAHDLGSAADHGRAADGGTTDHSRATHRDATGHAGGADHRAAGDLGRAPQDVPDRAIAHRSSSKLAGLQEGYGRGE